MPPTRSRHAAPLGPSTRATVMGLGRRGGGLAAARFLAHRGCQVTVSDQAPAELLQDSLDRLNDVPLAAVRCGGHDPDDFADADLVVVNPAVRPGHPLVTRAIESPSGY